MMDISIGLIYVRGEVVGDDDFLEKSPEHFAQTDSYPLKIEGMLFVELMEQILRSFDWSGHELGIEHDIERIDAEMAFGFLPAAIDFDDIGEALKGVE